MVDNWESDGPMPERQLPAARLPKVLIKVNGQTQGEVEQSEILGTVAKRLAQQAGIRSFAVKLTLPSGEERKADTAEAGSPLTGIATIDVIAKDTRG